ALFSFPDFARYERYRTDSATDPDCQAAFELARRTKCIRRYERRFLRPLDHPRTQQPIAAPNGSRDV
ncbi:NIPSNAP family protein, partial [Streptomyces roseolus]